MDKVPFRMYFDSEYLTGDSLEEGGTTFKIADKGRAEVEGHDGGKEHKLVLTFTDKQRFLCNVTNAKYLSHLFNSPYPADWVGHRITLAFDDSVMFGKERVGGIRVIGSPELTAPLTFMFSENSRKRPRPVTLVPTSDGPPVDPDTGEVAQEAASSTEPAESAPPMADAAPEPQEAFSAENGESDDDGAELDLMLGNVTPLREDPATAKQVAEIKRAVSSGSLYEVELAGLLEEYGGSLEADGYGLTKKAAGFVLAALKERAQ
jgi:hypothetical protein